MDSEETTRKADEYIQRLRARKREQDESPEHFSKTLRRRISIINSINERNTLGPNSSFVSSGNPFEKEFNSPRRPNQQARVKSLAESYEPKATGFHTSTLSPARQPERAYDKPPAPVGLAEDRRSSQIRESLLAARRSSITSCQRSRDSLLLADEAADRRGSNPFRDHLTVRELPAQRASWNGQQPLHVQFAGKRSSLSGAEPIDLFRSTKSCEVQPRDQPGRDSPRQYRASNSILTAAPADLSGHVESQNQRTNFQLLSVSEESSGNRQETLNSSEYSVDSLQQPANAGRRANCLGSPGADQQFRRDSQPPVLNAAPVENRGWSRVDRGVVPSPARATSDRQGLCQIHPDLLPASERMFDSPVKKLGLLNGDRLSFGEYFADPSNKKLSMKKFEKNYVQDTLDEEFAHGNAELQRQGPDLFFGARVLEVLEPEVTPSKLAPSTRRPTGPQQLTPGPARVPERTFVHDEPKIQRRSSEGTSFKSEDIRELDREIDKLMIYPDVELGQEVTEPIYEVANSNRRETNPFLQKLEDGPVMRLLHGDGTTISCAHGVGLSGTPSTPKPTAGSPEVYGTPMQMTSSRLEAIKTRQTERTPVKRSFSGFFRNLFQSARSGNDSMHKPPISPVHDCTVSTIMTTTPSSGNREDSMPTEPRQLETTLKLEHRGRPADAETTIPLEVQNFLKDALGKEHYASTIFEQSFTRDGNRIYMNVPEVKGEYGTPVTRRIDSDEIYAVPINGEQQGPSRSRALSKLKTLSQRFKRKLRKSLRLDHHPRADQLMTTPTEMQDASPSLQQKVLELRRKVEIQQTLIYQASKALALCCSMPEFTTSLERVESERALVLANLRNQALLDEIVRLTTQRRGPGAPNPAARSELELEELSLRLREDVLRRERHGDELAEWFVLMVAEGQRVWASRAVLCSNSASRLYFPDDRLLITDLASDFRLTIRVFSLKLHQQINYDHEARYHLWGSQSPVISAQTSSPGSNGLLRRSLMRKPALAPRMGVNITAATKNSSFVECGSVELTLRDVTCTSPRHLNGVPARSVLYGTIDLKMQCKLQLQVSQTGFVTLGEEVKGMAYWMRCWCALQEHQLLFWNYPRDREDEKPPVRTIDLSHCAFRQVELVGRELCARPKTLLIATSRRRDDNDVDSVFKECRSDRTIIRHLLSFDEKKDLEEWQAKINYVVSALFEWQNIVEY